MATPTLKGDEDDDEQTEETQSEPEEEEETETEVEVDEEEEVETEPVELPEGKQGEEDEEEKSRGFLSGSTFGISNKFLLGLGIASVLLVLWLSTSDSNSSTRSYEDDEQVEEEIDDGADGAVEKDVTDAGGSTGRFDAQAQQDSIDSVFGG